MVEEAVAAHHDGEHGAEAGAGGDGEHQQDLVFHRQGGGRFTYAPVPESVLYTGALMEPADDQGHYLIAGATKALCDKLLLTRNLRLSSVSAMGDFLEEDLRVEPEAISSPDMDVIRAYCEAGHKVALLELLGQTLEQWT